MLSARSHCYYYDIRWIFLFLINLFVRPELYLFFSDDAATTTTTTAAASPPSLLAAAFLSLLLLLFLSASLRACFFLEDNGCIFIRLMVSCRDGWSLPITYTFVLSLLCPTPVFLYIYVILLFILSLQHCLLCCCQYSSLNFNVLPMVSSSLLTSSPLPTQSFFYFYDMRWILLIVINCFLRPYFSVFFSNHINTYPQNPLKAFLLIALILIIFLFVSLHMCLTVSEDSDGMLYILVRINYRQGWSFLLAFALMFSLLCPTLVFLYLYPCLLLLSLWPSFFRNFLYRSAIRLQQGLATLLAYNAPTNTLQDEDDPAAAFA